MDNGTLDSRLIRIVYIPTLRNEYYYIIYNNLKYIYIRLFYSKGSKYTFCFAIFISNLSQFISKELPSKFCNRKCRYNYYYCP